MLSTYKIQETLFSVGFSTAVNIGYMSYFPTKMSVKITVNKADVNEKVHRI